MPVEETLLSTVLSQVSRRILEKLEKGKKLSTEDILLLYLDLMHREMRELREELRETNRRIDEVRGTLLAKIEETNRRIDSVQEMMLAKIEETNKRIDETNKRIDESNRRIDRVQEVLLAKIEETNRRIDELYKLYAELRSLIRQEKRATQQP